MLVGDQRVGEGWTLVHEPVAHRLERGSRRGLPTVPVEHRRTKHTLVCGAIQDATHVQRVLALDSVSLCLAHLDDILVCVNLGLHPLVAIFGDRVTILEPDLVKSCSGPATRGKERTNRFSRVLPSSLLPGPSEDTRCFTATIGGGRNRGEIGGEETAVK